MSKQVQRQWEAQCRHVSYKGGEWSRDEFLQWEVVGPEEPHGRGSYYQDDALLIAAAPDLLAALQTVLDSLGALTKRHELLNYMSEQEADYVFAAISKALGETS